MRINGPEVLPYEDQFMKARSMWDLKDLVPTLLIRDLLKLCKKRYVKAKAPPIHAQSKA